MPCAPGATLRKIFPPPMTIASSTPSVATSATSSVMRSMVERLIPNASSPISASPESLRRTRLYDLVVIGSIPGKQSNESVSQSRACVTTQARLFYLIYLMRAIKRCRLPQRRLPLRNLPISFRYLRPRHTARRGQERESGERREGKEGELKGR